MPDIPYKIAGETRKQSHPKKGQTFANETPLGAGQLPSSPPQFRPRQWRVINLALTNAQSIDLTQTFTGAAFWYISSTNTTDLLLVSFNSDTDYLPISPGMFIIGFPFNQLRFQWVAQAGAVATIAITDVFADEDFRVQS